MYLKNNATPTPITVINGRAIVEGTIQTNLLTNFIKDPSTNSLKYTGTGGRFHIIVTFSFYDGNQHTCGFYIGHNTDDTTPLDPDADRISESEIYANSSNPSTQPIAGTIQTVLDLNTNDRVFFIVQNKEATSDITVEFMKFTVTALTAEKGDPGVDVTNASVNTDGDLLIELSDATIINAGNVIGPAGATGPSMDVRSITWQATDSTRDTSASTNSQTTRVVFAILARDTPTRLIVNGDMLHHGLAILNGWRFPTSP
jgi:hypothetical protein